MIAILVPCGVFESSSDIIAFSVFDGVFRSGLSLKIFDCCLMFFLCIEKLMEVMVRVDFY